MPSLAKVAATDHDIDLLLRSRWSPRAFDDRPVTRAETLRLLEAARWAPSCANEQPWRFIVASRGDAAAFERILACLVESNRRWADRASLLIVLVAKLTFDRNGAPNKYAQHDVGMALANLLLQATAMGIASHPMAGFDADATRVACQIPAGFDPVSVTALGYPGHPDTLADPYREREIASRQRLAVAQLAFSGTWGREL
jgi:nitroreductase